ncbi:hypothetical protein BT69DRAFT_1220613 [Atractiella rhizophila]|nr:hypothetical protein BT69DRAFT_1220613 [Atractiella rhizophila]
MGGGDAINDQLFQHFPSLAQLSRDDLEDALRDPAYFDALFHSLPQVQSLVMQQESSLKSTIELAEHNNALRPALESLREETSKVFAEANNLRSRWEVLEKEQSELYRRFSLPSQLQRLRYATTQHDDLSESLANEFLEGKLAEEDFVKQYREIRKVYWKRVMWSERMAEGKVVWRD